MCESERASMGRWDVLPSVNHLNGRTNRKTKTWFRQCFRQSGGKRRAAVCCGHDSRWLTVLFFTFSGRCSEERGSFDYPWLTLVSLSAGNLKKNRQIWGGLADRVLKQRITWFAFVLTGMISYKIKKFKKTATLLFMVSPFHSVMN